MKVYDNEDVLQGVQMTTLATELPMVTRKTTHRSKQNILSDIEVALKKETRIRKEKQLNSDLVHLGTEMVVTMATTECLANARSNLLSLIKASMYEP